MSETLDRKDLKIKALLEKISNLTTNYENQIADLRVELTIYSNDSENTVTRLVNELEAANEKLKLEGDDVPQESGDSTD